MKAMKQTILILLTFTLLLSCGNETEGNETIKKVEATTPELAVVLEENNLFPVEIDLPLGWELAKDEQLRVLHILSPTNEQDEFQEMVNIVVGTTSDKELDEFFDLNLKVIQGMFEELNQTEKPSYQTINEIKYKKVRYNYLFAGLPLTAQLYVTIKDDKSFIINCSALQNTFDEYAKEFDEIVNSLEIK